MRHRARPLAQPRGERTDDPGALIGVPPDVVHLRAGELRRLREDLGRDHQLADVVEQRGPAQAGLIGGGQLHLVGDEVGEHPNTLRVTAGLPVVNAQRCDELEHHLHVRHLATGDPTVVGFLELPLQVARFADAARHGKAFRRVVGEEQ